MNATLSLGSVLVVDDEIALVRVLAMHLANLGYEVLTATDGEAALGQIRHRHPDVVVLDVMMPEMSGLEVCRRVREDTTIPPCKIIVLTANPAFQEASREAGADGFITKPFGLGTLTQAIAALSGGGADEVQATG